MAGPIQKRNLSRQIFDLLHHRITTLEIPPGERIDIALLCEELGVSPIPIREALKQLTERHLVEAKPNVGYNAVVLTDADVRQTFRMRRLLEGDAVELSIHSFDHGELEALRLRSESLESSASSVAKLRTAFDATDVALHHEQIIQHSGNDLLIRFYDMLMDMTSIIAHVSARIEDSITEHLTIIDALLAEDVEAAKKSIHEHLTRIESASLPLPRSQEEWQLRRVAVMGR